MYHIGDGGSLPRPPSLTLRHSRCREKDVRQGKAIPYSWNTLHMNDVSLHLYDNTHGLIGEPAWSVMVRRTMGGGAKGKRDKTAGPYSAVRSGCCSTSSLYVLQKRLSDTNLKVTKSK